MQDTKETAGKSSTENDEAHVDDDEASSESDGKYYYDDAHGYEDFDPDAADTDDDK